jgi:hypothetical protein
MSEDITSFARLLAYPSSRVVHPEDALPYIEPADVIDLGFYAAHKASITLEEHEMIRVLAARYQEEACAERLELGYPLSPIHERVLARVAYSHAAQAVAGINIDPHSILIRPDSNSLS